MGSEAEGRASTRAETSGADGDLVGASLTLTGLCSFAIAQPLYDLLAGHVTFLIAHDVTPIEVLAIAALVLLIPTAFVCTFVAGLHVLAPGATNTTVSMLVGLGVAAISLPPIHRELPLPGAVAALCAVALGGAATVAWRRSESTRSRARLLAIGAVVFPAWFLLLSPAAALLDSSRGASPLSLDIQGETPVVLVVFDQFPLFTLLDDDERIDRDRYPSFAALADQSDWFRNASTVAGETVLAVPALLTGIYPDRPRPPRHANYPINLFSLLGGSYRLNVSQTMTDMCPPPSCPDRGSKLPPSQRLQSILSDLRLLYLHVLLPADLRQRLPSIDGTWRDFNAREWSAPDATLLDPRSSWGDPTAIFQRFVGEIREADGRALHFLHINIPHVPWKYLPSGTVYGPVGRQLYPYPMNGLADIGPEDRWALDRALQRHLLQVGFADHLLGELVRRLRETGIYDSALVIVTADHGITFWPTKGLDASDGRAASDVLNVPLFIKRPHHVGHRVDDSNVETVDILPTIASLLEIPLPAPIDGHSVYDERRPKRSGKRVYLDLDGELRRVDYASRIPGRKLSVQRMRRTFGESSDPFGLFRIGRHRAWIGKPVDSLRHRDRKRGCEVELESVDAFQRVDLSSGFVPARVTGQIRAISDDAPRPREVAIAVNGTVWATTQTFEAFDGTAGFDAMVPEAAFHSGANNVAVYVVDGDGDEATLDAPPQRAHRMFSPVEALGSPLTIRGTDGFEIAVVPGALRGLVDSNGAMLAGWAREADGAGLPETILVFVNGRFYEERDLARARANTAQRAHLQDADQKTLKFDMVIPFEQLRDVDRPVLRVFAVSGNVASELAYVEGFAYHPVERN